MDYDNLEDDFSSVEDIDESQDEGIGSSIVQLLENVSNAVNSATEQVTGTLLPAIDLALPEDNSARLARNAATIDRAESTGPVAERRINVTWQEGQNLTNRYVTKLSQGQVPERLQQFLKKNFEEGGRTGLAYAMEAVNQTLKQNGLRLAIAADGSPDQFKVVKVIPKQMGIRELLSKDPEGQTEPMKDAPVRSDERPPFLVPFDRPGMKAQTKEMMSELLSKDPEGRAEPMRETLNAIAERMPPPFRTPLENPGMNTQVLRTQETRFGHVAETEAGTVNINENQISITGQDGLTHQFQADGTLNLYGPRGNLIGTIQPTHSAVYRDGGSQSFTYPDGTTILWKHTIQGDGFETGINLNMNGSTIETSSNAPGRVLVATPIRRVSSR